MLRPFMGIDEPIVLEYDLTLEDIHAFDLHYSRTGYVPVRARRLARTALTFLLATLLFTLGLWSKAPVPFWIVGLLILLGWYILFPKRFDQMMRRNTERIYAENPGGGLLGRHRLVLEPEWLSESTELRESRARWRAVGPLVATESHLFIFVTSFTSVIVPRRAFPSDESFSTFVATVERRRAEAALKSQSS
jgi:uncharacterized membrane protein